MMQKQQQYTALGLTHSLSNTASILAVVLTLMLTACGSDADDREAEAAPFAVSAGMQTWQQQTVDATYDATTRHTTTRATDEAAVAWLKSNGFGLYCSLFDFVNQKVEWTSSTESWSYGYPRYWNQYEPQADDYHVYAYAPYAEASDPHITPHGETLSFVPVLDNDIDLLYAHYTASTPGGATRNPTLDFHHALAAISFGTITNSYGHVLQLKSIALTGTLIQHGTFNIGSGTWTSTTPYTTAQTITRTVDTDDVSIGEPLDVAIGNNADIPVADILLIPGPTVTVTFTFSTTEFGDETASFTTTLEQGTNKKLNLTVGVNHEVVIVH